METTEIKTGSYALKFGVIAGLISVAFSVMLMLQGLHYEQGIANTIIAFVILFGVIAFGIFQFKKDNGGYLKLGQALKVGTGIALISAIIGLVYYYLLTNNIIEAGYMEKATAMAKEKLFAENPKVTEEQWNQGMEMQKKFMWLAYPVGLVINALMGLVGGLISGLIMKKEAPAY